MTGDEQGGGKPRDDRDAILARRRRFVVAAMSGVAMGVAACGKSEPGAQTAAEPTPPSATANQPMPCLSMPPPTVTTATTATVASSGSPEVPDSGAPDGGKPAPTPTPTPAPTPTPRPCLKIARPPG